MANINSGVGYPSDVAFPYAEGGGMTYTPAAPAATAPAGIDWAGGLVAASTLDELRRWKTALDTAYARQELNHQLYSSLLTGFHSKWATVQQGAAGGAGGGTGTPSIGVGTPSTGTPGTGGGTVGDVYGPFTEYAQGIGLGAGYWNPAEQYRANLYDPLRSLFELQQPIMAASAAQKGDPNYQAPDWANFLGRMGGGMGNVKSQASDVLRSLFNLGGGAQREAGLAFEPQYDPLTGRPLGSSATGNASVETLTELAKLGLAGKYGGIGSQWLAGRIPQMQQTWQMGQAGGAPQSSFMDYLRTRLGM